MHPNVEKTNFPPPEASEYLKTHWGIKRTPATLAKLRCVSSNGPVFYKANRQILYPRTGLDEYAVSLLSGLRRSTSDRSGDSISRPNKRETSEPAP
jgi:hypothetical protein